MIGTALLLAALGAPGILASGGAAPDAGADAWSRRDALEQAADTRMKQGIGFVTAGALGAAVGASLMIGEYAVRPRPGDVKVWRLEGCWISFVAGSLLLPLGVHAIVAGLALVARSRMLRSVADVVLLEGPGAWWNKWYGEARHLRVAGTVLTIVASAFLAGSLASGLPCAACDRWECAAWPDRGSCEGARDDGKFQVPIALAAVSSFLYVLGFTIMIVGHARQGHVLENRHLIDAKPRILLTLSPAGLALAW